MKIYNKKSFLAGLAVVLACTAGLCWGVRGGIQAGIGSVFGMGVYLILGVRIVCRSLSKEKSQKDRVAERDERNQAILQRSKSLAFDGTLWAGLAAAMVLAVLSKAGGFRDCAWIALGMFLTCCFGAIAQGLLLLRLHEKS